MAFVRFGWSGIKVLFCSGICLELWRFVDDTHGKFHDTQDTMA